MLNDYFSIGDVLFYDKINKGISNMSYEDAECDMYFDYKQYTALGVITYISEETSSIELLTLNFNKFFINGIADAVDEELIKKMKDIVKTTYKAFVKECGEQNTVEMYVPFEEDINHIIDEPEKIKEGLETLTYYCNQILTDKEILNHLLDENIAYIDSKNLNLLLGGINSQIYLHIAERNDKYLEEYMNKNFIKSIDKTVEEILNDVDKCINNSENTEDSQENNEIKKKKYVVMKKSLDQIKEKFKEVEILSFWLPTFMEIKINQ